MKIKIFFIAVLFFYILPAMDKPHPKRRRSELEDLLGETEKLYVCEVEGCPYKPNVYKAVADHERREHRIYRNSRHEKIPKKEESKPELFLCEFPNCKFYGVYAEVAAHEEKHDIDSPIKVRTAIPHLEALDKPEIPSHAHLLAALDKNYFEKEKKEIEEKIKRQEKRWHIRYARAEQLAAGKLNQCHYCPKHFTLRFEYMAHIFTDHNNIFPPHERGEAYRQRITRYQNTPTDEIVIID